MRRALRVDAATAVVLGLTVLGLALRVWGIQHGLPHPTSRPDEREVLDHTAQFATGDFNPRWFIYPPFYFHVTWLWDEAVLAVWRLWRPRAGYFELLRTNLAPLLLGGRLLTAALGAATVPVTWAIGRRLGGTALGLVATTLVAVCYLLVRDSHALKPDVPIALGVLVTLWLVGRYADAPSMRLAMWAGLAIGITTAFKYNGILLLIPAYLADVMAPSARRWRVLPSGTGWVLLLVGVGSFLLLDPHMVTDFALTQKTYAIATWNVYVTRPEAMPPPDAGLLERVWLFIRTRSFGYHLAWSLRGGCGLAIALATPIALLATLRRGAHPMLRLSAVFVVLYFVVAGASPVRLARYLTPIVPILLVLVANLVVTAARWVPGRWRTAAIVVATCLLCVEPFRDAVGFDRVAAQTDTRVLATDWLARQPAGTVVAIAGTGPFAEPEPVMPPNVRRAPLRLDPAVLRRDGIAYVIAVWHDDLRLFANGSPEELGELRPALRLVQEFSPFDGPPAGVYEQEDIFFIPFSEFRGVVRPGPLIRIYALATVS
jgi:4-amino-4-deoxy-L-arabinose transferase-like glycosyltransferase